MPLERWYRSQLQPGVRIHSTNFRFREKAAKILQGRNTYSKMMEDEALGAIGRA